jgi:gas vesicle protein
MNKNSNSSLFAFLAGVAAGAVIGILFAPDKGKNTRDKLSYQLTKYRDQLKDMINEMVDGRHEALTEAKSEGNKIINDAKEKAEKLLGDVEELIGQIKTKK